MNIAHLEFTKVPGTINKETLYQVAILCEQYQCVQIVAPWIRDWIHEAKQIRQSAAYGGNKWSGWL